MERRLKLAALTLGLVLLAPASAQATRSFSPSSLIFPGTVIDAESAPQTLTYSIDAAESYRTTAPYIARGPGGSGGSCPPQGFCDFRFTTTCPIFPATFGPGAQSCTFTVYFTPYESGLREGALEPGSFGVNAPLSGNGTNAPIGSGGGKKKKKCKKKGKKRAAVAKKKCGKKKK